MEEHDTNDVVVMLDKLDKMLEQSDQCRGDDPMVQERLQEQHNLIRELGIKFKFSVYKGIVMEARNANLLTENDLLKNKLNEEKEQGNQLQKKVNHLEESLTTFSKLKEEYEELSLSLKEGVMSLQKVSESEKPEVKSAQTSCHDLVLGSDKTVQTWLPRSGTNSTTEDEWEEPSVVLTQSDLARLDEDMTALKMSLKEREKSWGKMEKRDRNQRAKISRLDNELISLRETTNNRKQEIENKTILIKNLEMQLKKEQREIASLRKLLMAKERSRRMSKKGTSAKTKTARPNSSTPSSYLDDASDVQCELSMPSPPPINIPRPKMSSDSHLRQPAVLHAKDNPRVQASGGQRPPKRSRSRLTRTLPIQAPPSQAQRSIDNHPRDSRL